MRDGNNGQFRFHRTGWHSGMGDGQCNQCMGNMVGGLKGCGDRDDRRMQSQQAAKQQSSSSPGGGGDLFRAR